MKQLIMDYTPYVTRVALVEDGELIEFSVERALAKGIVGNIFKGKVENVLGGMKAAFVNIGLERNGFLYFGDSLVDSKRLHDELPKKKYNYSAGDVIMCQAIKDQFGQKGARLTTDISLPGYFLVFLPTSSFLGVSRKIDNEKRRDYLEHLVKTICPKGCGFIIRSAADTASDDDIILEAQHLVETWQKVQQDFVTAPEKSVVFEECTLFERALRDSFSFAVDKVVVNDGIIADAIKRMGNHNVELYAGERSIMSHFNLTTQINHLCDRKVQLENGAHIVIDKTEALTVIDVNTGKYVGSTNLEDTVFKTNLAAAKCIAKQIRLRNISGIVVIDFIDMQLEEHRQAVLQTLNEELKKDRLKTSTVGMTPLGLVELTRKKARLPIDEFMLKACTHCEGGYVTSDVQIMFRLRDELIDFVLAHRCSNEFWVGVNPNIFNMVFDSGMYQRQAELYWKDKTIYLYQNAAICRSKFVLSDKCPDGVGQECRILSAFDEHIFDEE